MIAGERRWRAARAAGLKTVPAVIRERLDAQFGARMCSPLRYDVKVDEAQSHGRTVFDYAPTSKGAKMLATIAEEVWNRVS